MTINMDRPYKSSEQYFSDGLTIIKTSNGGTSIEIMLNNITNTKLKLN